MSAKIHEVPRRPGGELRGNSRDRKRRKEWLLQTFGNGTSAPCSLKVASTCPGRVTMRTVTADRITPGADGGRYVRGNIRPACLPCNQMRGDSADV